MHCDACGLFAMIVFARALFRARIQPEELVQHAQAALVLSFVCSLSSVLIVVDRQRAHTILRRAALHPLSARPALQV